MSTYNNANRWYPYHKIQEGYIDLSDSVNLPRKICDYLIDAPQGTKYTPQDDNTYPRCRLWKYLYYDTARPLDQPLPTIAEKMSVVFNSDQPENPPTDKGYRLYPEIYVKQAQTAAQTRLMVYMGRTMPSDTEYKVSLSIVFDIFAYYAYEANTKTDVYSRVFAIEQALIEAFHGVNMAGIGTFYFSKNKHPDCGSRPIYDGKTNIGRQLILCLETATTALNAVGGTENMQPLDENTTIYLA